MTQAEGFNQRFDQFIQETATDLHYAHWYGRTEVLSGYCQGLLVPNERKSMEPIAGRMDPYHAQASREAVQQFITDSQWDDQALVRSVRRQFLPVLLRTGPILAWIVDDTAFPKSGSHSVGVARQYCGVKGKKDNCQDAVSLSVANERTSLPCGFRLYLPESWAKDEAARTKAGVPKTIRFQTKIQIAMEMIEGLLREGVQSAPVLADAAYGNASEFREFLTGLGLRYVVGIQSSTTVWAPGTRPLPPRPWTRGPRPNRLQVDPKHPPKTVLELARSLPAKAWHARTWWEGSRGALTSRFAALRVRSAHRTEQQIRVPALEWLVIEWPEGESEPTHYWLSTLPANTPVENLIRMAKLRWRIERDYQVLKDQLGLDHFEGRTWRGFHHHASLCIAVYGFLVAEEARLFPPTVQESLQAVQFAVSQVQPWAAPPHTRGSPRPILARDPSDSPGPGSHGQVGLLPLLWPEDAAGGPGGIGASHS